MKSQLVVANARTEADARWALSLATGTAIAYGVFAAWPVFLTDPRWLFGLDALWGVAGFFTVLLGPLAAAMAAYWSFLALWVHGAELSVRARQMHVLTLLVVAALLVAMVSPWGADVVSWWLGD